MTKKWYLSITLWANVAMVIAVVANHLLAEGLITPEIEAVVVALVNVVLRLKTNSGVTP